MWMTTLVFLYVMAITSVACSEFAVFVIVLRDRHRVVIGLFFLLKYL
jgi:hypothetical protein